MSCIYSFIIIREWNECKEFKDVNKIIIVGNKIQYKLAEVYLKKFGKRVYYCPISKFKKIYKYQKKTKWILFDKNVLSSIGMKNRDIICMPNL